MYRYDCECGGATVSVCGFGSDNETSVTKIVWKQAAPFLEARPL